MAMPCLILYEKEVRCNTVVVLEMATRPPNFNVSVTQQGDRILKAKKSKLTLVNER